MFIFETELPQNKSVFIGLQHIYGIGVWRSRFICRKLGFSKNLKCRFLSTKQLNNIIRLIKDLEIDLGSDLKRKKEKFLNKLLSIKSYRGLRVIKGLPVRGQRTHTNASTAKALKPRRIKTMKELLTEMRKKTQARLKRGKKSTKKSKKG